jgi:hypothetical protein
MGAQTTMSVVWAILRAYAAHRGSAALRLNNLPMAQTTIDVVWDHFECDPTSLSGRSTAWWQARQSGLLLTKSSD